MMARVALLLQRPAARIALAIFFSCAGLLHFIFPQQYAGAMPPWLPAHAALVLVSGVCELAGGIGLLVPQLRRAAGIGLLLLCVAVWPANLQMLMSALAADKAMWIVVLLTLRLPLQIPLMLWIWYASRR